MRGAIDRCMTARRTGGSSVFSDLADAAVQGGGRAFSMSRDDMLVAELEAEAMSAAERAVRTWLPMMFGAEELQELCTAYGVTPAAPGEDYEALFTRLMEPFAEAHLSQLSRPPVGWYRCYSMVRLRAGRTPDEAGVASWTCTGEAHSHCTR